MSDDRLLTYAEAAELLGIKATTLRHWVSSRKIEHLKIGSNVRFTQEQLARFIERSTVPSIFSGGAR